MNQEINHSFLGYTTKFETTYGLFSYKEVDKGTEMLIENLKLAPKDTCLDMGCGYGPIGIYMSKISPDSEIHFVDRDFVALEYTEKNCTLNGITKHKTHLSDGFRHLSKDLSVDVIAGYLPSHISNDMLRIMIHDSLNYLRPGGRFYVGGVRKMSNFFEKAFISEYGNFEILDKDKMYFVGLASKNIV